MPKNHIIKHRKRYHTDREIALALKQSRGFVSVAAENLNMAQRSVHSRIQKSQALQEQLEEIREATVDRAEGLLWQHIENGEIAPLIFYLKCKARHRGFTDKESLEIGGPHKLIVEHVYEDLEGTQRVPYTHKIERGTNERD